MTTTKQRIYSVQATVETEKLLERLYGKIIAERLNQGLPLMAKYEAFAEVVRKAAAVEGVCV
jgi:hypothetical protein